MSEKRILLAGLKNTRKMSVLNRIAQNWQFFSLVNGNQKLPAMYSAQHAGSFNPLINSTVHYSGSAVVQ